MNDRLDQIDQMSELTAAEEIPVDQMRSSPLFLRFCLFFTTLIVVLVSANIYAAKWQLVLVQAIVLFMGVATVAFGFVMAHLKIKMNLEVILTFCFWLWSFFGLFIARESQFFMVAYITLTKTVGLYLVYVNIVRSRKDLIWMAFGYVVTMMCVFFMNIDIMEVASAEGVDRSAGSIGDANGFATFAIFGGLFALMCFHVTKNKILKLLFLCTTPFAIYMVNTSGSRSGILGLIIIVALLYWYYIRPLVAGKGGLAVATGNVLGIASTVVVLFILVAGPFWSRVERTFGLGKYAGQSEMQKETRIAMTIAGFKLMLKHPVLGVGYSQFQFAVPEVSPELSGLVSHNTWSDAGCGGGLLGLGLWLGAWVVLVNRNWKLRKNPYLPPADRGLVAICLVLVFSLTFRSMFFVHIGDKVILPVIAGITGYLSSLSEHYALS
jgi:O-antigen ligase